MVKDGPQLTRAYKPPSLRGAATRPPYMHSGQFATLEEVVDHYVARAGSAFRRDGTASADAFRARAAATDRFPEDAGELISPTGP